MADVINAVTGFGTTAGTGTAAAPEDIYTMTRGTKRNFVTITNTDGTNWFLAKDAVIPGPYKVALPGASLTIAVGPQSANNLSKIVGFGCAPGDATTGHAVQVVLAADKMA